MPKKIDINLFALKEMLLVTSAFSLYFSIAISSFPKAMISLRADRLSSENPPSALFASNFKKAAFLFAPPKAIKRKTTKGKYARQVSEKIGPL